MDDLTSSDAHTVPSDPTKPTPLDTPGEPSVVPAQEEHPAGTADAIDSPQPAADNVPVTATDIDTVWQPIPSFSFPLRGEFPITFSFAAIPDDETVKKQYAAWGLSGHNGIDFALPEGTTVCACADGTIVHAGENGGFGTCIIIRHPWGTSLYGHLQECKQSIGAIVQTGDVIGLSGKTGFVTGAHLHFGIKPLDADEGNGYGGYIDPDPYLQLPVPKTKDAAPMPEEPPLVPPADPTPAAQSPSGPLPSPHLPADGNVVVKEIVREVIKEVHRSHEQENAHMHQLKEQSKAAWEKKKNIIRDGILAFAASHPAFTNEDIRTHLHLPQSTVTRYLRDLAGQNKLRRTGKGRAITYSRT